MSTFCSICFDLLVGGPHDIVALQGCGHVFHSNCVAPWVRSHKQCPCCRKRVTPKSTVKLFIEIDESNTANSGSASGAASDDLVDEERRAAKAQAMRNESKLQMLLGRLEVVAKTNEKLELRIKQQNSELQNVRKQLMLSKESAKRAEESVSYHAMALAEMKKAGEEKDKEIKRLKSHVDVLRRFDVRSFQEYAETADLAKLLSDQESDKKKKISPELERQNIVLKLRNTQFKKLNEDHAKVQSKYKALHGKMAVTQAALDDMTKKYHHLRRQQSQRRKERERAAQRTKCTTNTPSTATGAVKQGEKSHNNHRRVLNTLQRIGQVSEKLTSGQAHRAEDTHSIAAPSMVRVPRRPVRSFNRIKELADAKFAASMAARDRRATAAGKAFFDRSRFVLRDVLVCHTNTGPTVLT